MKVLVDTCVWSLAFRRTGVKEESEPVVRELQELIHDSRVQMIGPIRQEVLSGIRTQAQFEVLRDHLRAFPDLEITFADYELAAAMFNKLRSKGIQGSNTDYLLCALSQQYHMPIYTVDADFLLFKKHLPIKLHQPRTVRAHHPVE